MTGRELRLRRADPEALKLYAASVQLYHLHLYVDMAGKMNMLKYSFSDFLDSMGAFRGVARKPAAPATVRVRFTLSAAQPSVVTVPEGTKVSDGGGIFFSTDEAAEIAAGDMHVDIPCTCQAAGVGGNGILAGAVNTLVDPVPYMEKVASIEPSSGGSEVEDDDNFAYRLYLAPSAYSTAGPEDAYIYHTKSYSAAIGDVEVYSPRPVEVEVRFLLADGSLPTGGLCREVQKHLDDVYKRPLTDHVSVLAPACQGFGINFTYYINRSDGGRASSIQAQVEAAVRGYIGWQEGAIGRDINPDELRARVKSAGAKRLDIISPGFTRVPRGHVARVQSQDIVYGGAEDD